LPYRETPKLVSVVVPALNAAATLHQQFEALAKQDYAGPSELIFVDNGSDDETIGVAEDWKAKLRLRVVDASARRGISFARNQGWRAASGDLIAFTDADDVVDIGWLSALVAAGPRADLLGGPYEYNCLNDPVVRSWREAWPADGLWLTRGFLPFAATGNFAVWVEVLKSLGGFNEGYQRGATDVEFCWRAQLASYTLCFVPGAVVHHRYRHRVSDLGRQFYRYGRADAHLYRDFRASGMPREGVTRSLLSAGWSILHLPDLLVSRSRRGRWVRRASYRAGRVAGSVRFGVLYP
jgi:glycosyltransferase involved in cell wall biosynthesis